MTVLGAQLFFWARLAYAVVYLAGIAWLRTAVWAVSMVGVVLLLQRGGIMGGRSTPTVKPKVSAAPTDNAPAPSGAPSDAAAPAGSGAAPANSAAPDPSASGAAAGSANAPTGEIAPPKDPKTLSPQQGYLVVKTKQENVEVLIQGAHAGKTNEPLEVACGTKFIALGKAGPANSYQVVGEGQTVKIECQALTNVDFK